MADRLPYSPLTTDELHRRWERASTHAGYSAQSIEDADKWDDPAWLAPLRDRAREGCAYYAAIKARDEAYR